MKPIILGVVVLVVAFGVYVWWSGEQEPTVAVASFEECVAAGNPVMESYPRQCRDAASGELFVEDVEPIVEPEPEPMVFITDQGNDDIITLATPQAGDTIESPLIMSGEARGMWYFEASFPVELVDSEGERIAIHYATADGDWMTEDYVPFTSELEFNVPEGETSGTLILHRDNPSGLPENDDRLEIPVMFMMLEDDLEAELEVM